MPIGFKRSRKRNTKEKRRQHKKQRTYIREDSTDYDMVKNIKQKYEVYKGCCLENRDHFSKGFTHRQIKEKYKLDEYY